MAISHILPIGDFNRKVVHRIKAAAPLRYDRAKNTAAKDCGVAVYDGFGRHCPSDEREKITNVT